jgi:CheY-like chemotaxis protein
MTLSEAAHRILVVEDQRLIAADIENTLKKLGYVVLGNVSSGEDAICATSANLPSTSCASADPIRRSR